jgi:hypothetical protein
MGLLAKTIDVHRKLAENIVPVKLTLSKFFEDQVMHRIQKQKNSRY